MRDPILVMDNTEAMRILTEVGLIDQMTPRPGFNTTHAMFGFNDYWCLGSYHRGHAKEEDNGFQIVMVPKESMSAEVAEEMFNEIIEGTTAGRTEREYLTIGSLDRQ